MVACLDYAISSLKTDLVYDLEHDKTNFSIVYVPYITLDELKEIREEILTKVIRKQGIDSGYEYDYEFVTSEDVLAILDKKISELEGKE